MADKKLEKKPRAKNPEPAKRTEKPPKVEVKCDSDIVLKLQRLTEHAKRRKDRERAFETAEVIRKIIVTAIETADLGGEEVLWKISDPYVRVLAARALRVYGFRVSWLVGDWAWGNQPDVVGLRVRWL